MRELAQAAADTAAFFAVSVAATLAMTADARLLWAAGPLGLGALAARYGEGASPLGAFKAAKALSSLAALLLVNAMQLGWRPPAHVVAAVLGVNMLEAAATDLAMGWRHGWPNALCGLLLVGVLGGREPVPAAVVLFPLTPAWVALYTSWDSAFAAGVGFSWSFCLVQFTPIAVSALLGRPHAWLGARTYSLVLNQALRGSRAMWIYEPGRSYITKPEGAPSVDQRYRFAAGAANLALGCVCWAAGLL
jgi:hypothetical protein